MSTAHAIHRGFLVHTPTAATTRWRRNAIGTALVLHGLAHSSAITWATGTAPSWFVSLLWMTAMIGYLSAGLGILGTPLVRIAWPGLLVAATLASMTMLALIATPVAAIGLFVDLMLVPGAVRWGRPEPEGSHPRRIASTLGILFLAYVMAVVLWHPVYVQWGTTPDERATELFGDNGLTQARYRLDHAVTINAPADSVWPWLAQLGQDRGGFYSYDWLERLFGDDVHNANTIHQEWQQLAPGAFIRAAQPGYLGGRFGDLGWRVTAVLPGRAFVLENWGAFVLQPVDSTTTRFLIRTRGDGESTLASVALGPIGTFVFEPAHFIMQRRMMLGVRERAEAMMGA